MPIEGLTDREWWLICRVQRDTLKAVLDGCEESGLPGKIIAKQMHDRSIAGAADPILRRMTSVLLEQYKPGAGGDADPR